MGIEELWKLALAHHVPYFLGGLLIIWQLPNLQQLWSRVHEARAGREGSPAEARVLTSEPPGAADLREQLRELSALQEDVAGRLAALQQEQRQEGKA